METKKTVISDMRLLGRLFEAFLEQPDEGEENENENVQIEDMFNRKNFERLIQAINTITNGDDKSVKYGMKYCLYYLIKNAAETLMCTAYTTLEDVKGDKLKQIVKLLKFWSNSIFGDATYMINKSRQEKLRTPEVKCDESDKALLREYTLTTIEKLTQPYTLIGPNEYVSLRDNLCSKLTLFNTRRGGETCSLKI